MGRKDSGVLSPLFSEEESEKTSQKRKVMYFVSQLFPGTCCDRDMATYIQAAGSGIPEVKTILSGICAIIHVMLPFFFDALLL